MRKLVEFFVDRSLLVNLITVFVCVAGVVVATMTTRALLPAGGPKAIEVAAELPGASALEVEKLVTFRLEEALTGMKGLKKLTSTTTNGRVELELEIEPSVEDLTKPLEDARSRLTAIRHRLPADLRPLRIHEEQVESDFMNLLLTGVDEANPDHRRAVKALAEKIGRLPNVIQAETTMRAMNVYIRFSRPELDRLGLNVTLCRRAILEYLVPVAVGGIRVQDQDITVEIVEPFDGLDDLRRLPIVVNRAGRGTRLADVATVEYGFAEEEKRRTLNGEPYVEIWIGSAEGTDTITISEQVREILKTEAGEILPAPIAVRIGQDASELIEHEIDTLRDNGIGGVVVVLVILMLFLGWRVSAMTALGLPFCYLGLMLVIQLFDINFNFVSLVAMILVIGILVDDAIIISEEFCQQLAIGQTAREAAVNAVARMGKPVVGMVATTTAAFLPLLILKGGGSWMVRPLPVIIIAALFLSLFESFFLLPNHLRHLLPTGTKLVSRKSVEAVRRMYEAALRRILGFRYVTVVVFLGLVGACVYLLMGPVEVKMGLHMSGRATILIELAEPAASLDDLGAAIEPVESLVSTLPGDLVDHHKTQLGWAYALKGDNILKGWSFAQVEIVPPGVFVEQEEKRRTIGQMLKDRLAALEQSPEFKRVRLQQLAADETRDVVTVYVSGGDRIELTEIQNEIRAALEDVEEVKDVYMDQSRFQRSWRFRADRAAILAYGLSKTDVHAQLREYFSRQELLRLRSQGEEIEVYLGFQTQPEPDPTKLSRLTVMTDRGTPVPLSYLGKWEEVEVLRHVEHQDMLRMFRVDVLYDQAKVDAEAVAAAIEEKLASVRAHYPAYHVSVKPSEVEQEAKSWALQVVLLCVALIYVSLALSLGSLVQPVVVIFAIPFGFIGVVLAFYLHGMMIGLMAVIGILGLAGVVVNDSLVMTSTINDVVTASPTMALRDAIVEGGGRRFRAVVLTSLTTLGGVFPLAYGIAGRPGWIQPMVLAVGWGLLFATVLTLFFLPCLLLVVDDGRRLGRWVFRRFT